MNGLFDEHEQTADIDLFPIRETQVQTRWAAGGIEVASVQAAFAEVADVRS